MFDRISYVRQTSGPFSAEFRVLDERGEVHWVLNRGALVRNGFGLMQGLGIYIDTTDSHQGPFTPPASMNQDIEDSLVAAADRCIEIHLALKQSGYTDLHKLSGYLLFEIGRALARF
ncbi:hypothetical protein MKK69_16285 [Methylobacterium sp. J-026]|nr:hypothetical protein [Methylobacterium sp. J-026]MCJ2135590.1 hypothetical protein [Methylobacterium sp. J-026]